MVDSKTEAITSPVDGFTDDIFFVLEFSIQPLGPEHAP